METEQAEYRFLHDVEFHAKVALAVSTIERERGVRLDESDRSLATLAAAVALLVPGPIQRQTAGSVTTDRTEMTMSTATRPAFGADVPNGEDIRDVCRAVVEEFGPRRLPKCLRLRFLDPDGALICRIAERVLARRYPSGG